MRIAIMQPYLFPYWGYFQLIASVDRFVFLDDVSFMKRKWINRNILNTHQGPRMFSIPLEKSSQNKLVNEVAIVKDQHWKIKFYKTLKQSYQRAPHYAAVSEIIHSTIDSSNMISEVAKESILAICQYLDFRVEFIRSSRKYRNEIMRGQKRIIDICLKEHAQTYYNLPGGRPLYQVSDFNDINIDLIFIEPDSPCHLFDLPQNDVGLSMIDVLMHVDPQSIHEKLKTYNTLNSAWQK